MIRQSEDNSSNPFDTGEGEELHEFSSGEMFDRGNTDGCFEVWGIKP